MIKEAVEITFLGTGTSQGVPVILCPCEVCKSMDKNDQRLRSSIWIKTQNTSLLIDAGPDFRQQMLTHRVQKLDAILLTHSHKDHVGGLDDVRAFNYFQKKAMPIFGLKEVLKNISSEFAYAFGDNRYPGVPDYALHEVTDNDFNVGNINITPIKALHYQQDVLGYRMLNFAYLTDVSQISDEEKKKLGNLDVLIINALRIKPHYSHFNLQQALEIISQVNPQKAYLTHISHMMGLHSVVSGQLPENVYLSHDGLKIKVSPI